MFTVAAPGFQNTSVRMQSSKETVHLQAGIPVVIKLEDMPELPSNVTLTVYARRGNQIERRRFFQPHVDVDASGTATLVLPEVGEWEFHCSLLVQLQRGARGSEQFGRTRATVHGDEAAQVVSMSLDDQVVSDFLVSLD